MASANNNGEESFNVRDAKSFRLDFCELWKSKKFSDVVFVCEDGQLKSHKCILSARSELFRSMFDDEGGNSNLKKVEAEDVTVAEMDQLLKYLYTGSIKISKPEHAFSLIKLADKYQFYSLRDAGFDLLVKNMNLNNAGQLVKLAYNHQAPDEVKLKMQEYVITMRAELAKVPEYQTIVSANPEALTSLMLGQFAKE